MADNIGRETITLDEQIEFAADYFRIIDDGARLICSFDGQFLKDKMPFEPPMRYSIIGRGVITRDKRAILTPIYYSLLLDREGKSAEHSRFDE